MAYQAFQRSSAVEEESDFQGIRCSINHHNGHHLASHHHTHNKTGDLLADIHQAEEEADHPFHHHHSAEEADHHFHHHQAEAEADHHVHHNHHFHHHHQEEVSQEAVGEDFQEAAEAGLPEEAAVDKEAGGLHHHSGRRGKATPCDSIFGNLLVGGNSRRCRLTNVG